MADLHSSSIVIGASMSGLLAARALGRHFRQVTVVERDVLPDGPALRKGVPQAGHAHGLLASGYRVMEEYFPGLMDELEACGAPRGDVVGDFLWFQYGRWKLRHRTGLRGITVSRPCLEAAIRRRVKALPNVRFLEGVGSARPAFDGTAGRVTGLMVQARDNGAGDRIEAELVVDATGRGSQSPRWLDDWGFGRPEEQVVKVDVGYATRSFERRPHEFFDSIGAMVSGTPPASTRLAAVLAAEGRRWVVTLAGVLGDYPPTTEKAWVEFAASLPVPAVHELVTSARPLSGISSYRFPANQRRLYERMKRFPAGYLVVGDAVCSFNPIYGQGMSVAATEARALDESLALGLTDLATRFYGRARKIVDIPWAIATGEDLRYPQIEGPRPRGSWLVNRYLERVHAVGSQDETVCRKFFDVLNLLAAPPTLMAPAVVWRVLTRPLPAGPGSPWGTNASGRPDLEPGDDPLHRVLDVVARPAADREQDDLVPGDGGDDHDALRLRRAVAARQPVEPFRSCRPGYAPGAGLDARGAKAQGGAVHDVSQMATGERGDIDRDRRRHIAAEGAAPQLDGAGLLGDVPYPAAREGFR
jgi:2-polyprenyl-6-methoxyphenol hydroxylase-like FAD-dependent oxidoreductase